MDTESLNPPLVLVRVPRQKFDALHTLTINGMRALVVGEPKRGINYARLAKIHSQGNKLGLALMIVEDISQFINKDPLIISYKKLGDLEATLQILGHKLEDLPRAWI